MNKTFQHFISILDDLIEKNEFFQFYFQSPYSLEGGWYLNEIYNAPPTIQLECGATRGTLISCGCDEVVKFNLDSSMEDACDYEVSIYEDAVAAKLNECFARCYYLGTYKKSVHTWPASMFEDNGRWDDWNFSEEQFQKFAREENGLTEEDKCEIVISIPLYAYEKASDIGFFAESETADSDIASSYDIPLMERDTEIGANFVHEYGEAFYAALSAFLNEHNVNDIHCGNIGWIGSRFVMIDYAGYHC